MTENQIKEFLREMGADTESLTAKSFIREQMSQSFDTNKVALQMGVSPELVRRTYERLENAGRLNQPFEGGSDDTEDIFIKENNPLDSTDERIFKESTRAITGESDAVESSSEERLYRESCEAIGVDPNGQQDEGSNEDSIFIGGNN